LARRPCSPVTAPLRPFAGDTQITRDDDLSAVPKRTPETIALEALGWVLTDQPRADRLLALTGLTADSLRDGLGERAVLGAVLEFLAGHEADLVAAAIALDLAPEEISAAARALAA
jgi:hypothetical protein